MKLALLNSLAVLCIALDGFDEDVAFLRMLASNVTSNGTNQTVTSATNSPATTSPASAATSPATTSPAGTAQPQTAGTSQTQAAQTQAAQTQAAQTQAAQTQAAGTAQTQAASEPTDPDPVPSFSGENQDALCGAASLSSIGWDSVDTVAKQSHHLMTVCKKDGSFFEVPCSKAPCFTPLGLFDEAAIAANSKLCETAGGTPTTTKCNDPQIGAVAKTEPHYKSGRKLTTAVILAFCCFADLASMGKVDNHLTRDMDVSKFRPYTGSVISINYFSDSTCDTKLANPADAIPFNTLYGGGQLGEAAGGAPPLKFDVDSCYKKGSVADGGGMKIKGCDQAQNKYLVETFIDEKCQFRIMAGLSAADVCSAISGGSGNTTTAYTKVTCNGGEVGTQDLVTTKTTIKLSAADLSSLTQAQECDIVKISSQAAVDVGAEAAKTATGKVPQSTADGCPSEMKCKKCQSVTPTSSRRSLRERRHLSAASPAVTVATKMVLSPADALLVKGAVATQGAQLQSQIKAKAGQLMTAQGLNVTVSVEPIQAFVTAYTPPPSTPAATTSAAHSAFGIGLGAFAALLGVVVMAV